MTSRWLRLSACALTLLVLLLPTAHAANSESEGVTRCWQRAGIVVYGPLLTVCAWRNPNGSWEAHAMVCPSPEAARCDSAAA